MKASAQVVVLGAGVVGASVAYHLAELRWTDVVVVDMGPLPATGGSSSHAPGLVFQTNPSRMMAQLAHYTVELYGAEAVWVSHSGGVGPTVAETSAIRRGSRRNLASTQR